MRCPKQPFFFAIACVVLQAQDLPFEFDPEGANANLYFPQFAVGGSNTQRWETRFVFYNPGRVTSYVRLNLFAADGSALSADLDIAPEQPGQYRFEVEPRASLAFVARSQSTSIRSGWARALATTSLVGVVFYRAIENGRPAIELSTYATLPTQHYTSLATRSLGVAIANVASASLVASLELLRSDGSSRGTRQVTLGPRAQRVFNLNQIFPEFTGEERGVLIIRTSSVDQLICWALNSDPATGLLSTLPPGQRQWPISHRERIENTYWKLQNTAAFLAKGVAGVDLYNPEMILEISQAREINAWARPDLRTIQINIAFSELISDSPSELAAVIAHEIGHIIQGRANRLLFDPQRERDADQWGMLICLFAGYDPYGAAGSLAKINMATGQAGLLAQYLTAGPHGAFSERISAMYGLLRRICTAPQFAGFCANYRQAIHPTFPDFAPLAVEPVPANHPPENFRNSPGR